MTLPTRAAVLVAALAAALTSAAAAQATPASGGPASGSPAPADPPGAIVARDVVVGPDETLRDIARRELGRAGYAPPLADFNGLVESAALIEGAVVRVPVHVPARGEVALAAFAGAGTTLDGAPLETGARIVAGAELETAGNGFLSLELASGSMVTLRPGTRATLAHLECFGSKVRCLIELAVERGGVSGEIASRDGRTDDFRLSTAHGSAALRGGAFDASVDARALRLGVTAGTATLDASGTEVSLPAGSGAVARTGEPPSEPRALLPGPVFSNVPTRVASGDAVRWWAPAGAASWTGTVSLDAAGVEPVAAFALGAVDGLDLGAVTALAPGDYTLNLRALDETGLAGYRSQTRVTLAAVDPALAPPELGVGRSGGEFLVTVGSADDGAPGYEIQISEDPDFADPLAVDVGPPGSAVFGIDADTVYARARVLATPTSVSAFGSVASSDP